MNKVFNSQKGSEQAVNLPFTIAIAILIFAVIIFVLIPLFAKPLNTDPCLQQNGVRATTCNTSVASQNNFVDPDQSGNVCCVARIGQQEAFNAWAKTLANKTASTMGVVTLSETAAGRYQTPQNNVGLYIPSKNVHVHQANAEEDWPKKENAVVIEPNTVFDLVGVNNFADGSCQLTIREAELVNDMYKPKIAEEPKESKPEATETTNKYVLAPGFFYESDECAVNTGAQITGRLAGLAGDDSYYIATYTVKATEGILPAHILIASQTREATPQETPTASTTTNCPSCSSFTEPETCVAQQKSEENSCKGCRWLESDECVTCVVLSCSEYQTIPSCEADPCNVAGTTDNSCVWLGKTCETISGDVSCSDFQTRRACKAVAGCDWKGVLFNLRCETASTPS